MAEEESGSSSNLTKQYPSLPSNYVTITQLKERWLQEKQRKQEEKEKQEQKEQEERKRREESVVKKPDKNRHTQKVDLISKDPKSEVKAKTTDSLIEAGVNRNGYGRKMKTGVEVKPRNGYGNRGILIAKEPKLEVKATDSVIETRVDGTGQRKNEHKLYDNRNMKARVGIDLSGGTGHVSLSDVIQEEPMVQNGKNRENEAGKRRNLIAKEPKSEVKTTESVTEGGGSSGNENINHKNKQFSKQMKPRVEVNLAGDMPQVPSGDVTEEVPVVQKRKNSEKHGANVAGYRLNLPSVKGSRGSQKCVIAWKPKLEVKTTVSAIDGIGHRNHKNKQNSENVKPRVDILTGDKAQVLPADVTKEEIPMVVNATNDGVEISKIQTQCNSENMEFEGVSVSMVEGGNTGKNVDREIPVMSSGKHRKGKTLRVGLRKKKNSKRIGTKLGEHVETVEQSAADNNTEEIKPNSEVKTTDSVIEGRIHGIGHRKNKKKRSGKKMKPRVELKLTGDTTQVLPSDVTEEEMTLVVSAENGGIELSKVKPQCNNENMQFEGVSVCMVKVVPENNVDREIPVISSGKDREVRRFRVGFRENKNSKRTGTWLRKQVDTMEQSAPDTTAEEEVSVVAKERIREKEGTRGAFRAYVDKRRDLPLIDSEASYRMKVERKLEDLSLSDRKYGYGRSNMGLHSGKWKYGSSRRYDSRKMSKQNDNSYVWIKKGESSNGNAAEIKTQNSG